jgi:hypothetical protein
MSTNKTMNRALSRTAWRASTGGKWKMHVGKIRIVDWPFSGAKIWRKTSPGKARDNAINLRKNTSCLTATLF